VNIGVNQSVALTTLPAYFATADLTGLASFTAGSTATPVTSFNVGVGAGSSYGNLLLSNTANTIVATALTVGSSVNAPPDTTLVHSTLIFGTGTNLVNADTIIIGSNRTNVNVAFLSQTTGSPGTITIRNAAGTGAVSSITIGNTASATNAVSYRSTLDLSGHVADVQVATLNIGVYNSVSSTGSNSGTVSFDAGTFLVTTLNIGTKSNVAGGSPSNILNVAGGTFTVSGDTVLNTYLGTGTNNLTSTINLSGGTFTTGTYTGGTRAAAGSGASNSNINVSGGTFTVSGSTFLLVRAATGGGNNNNGTLNITGTGLVRTNADITDGAVANSTSTITLNGGTLDLENTVTPGTYSSIGSLLLPVNNVNLQSGILRNVAEINGGAIVVKSTAGTLTISGTNTFTGATSVTAGTLILPFNSALGTSASILLTGGTLALRSDTNNDLFTTAVNTVTVSVNSIIDVNQSTVAGTNRVLRVGSVGVIFSTSSTLTASGGNGYSLRLGPGSQSVAGLNSTFTTTTANITLDSFTGFTSGTGTLTSAGTTGRTTITGSIFNNGSTLNLTRAGSGGTLILQGTSGSTNGINGLVSITSGTVQTAVATAFGTPSSAISIGGTGILALRGDNVTTTFGNPAAYAITTSATGATVNVDQATVAGTNQTFTLGTLTTVSIAGTVTYNFTGANNTSLVLGAFTAGTVTSQNSTFANAIAGGGTLTVASVAYTGNTATSTVTFNGVGNSIVTGAITQNLANAVALTYSGTGSLALQSTNSFTGATNLNSVGGTLSLQAAGALTNTAITINSGTLTQTVNNAISGTSSISLAGTSQSLTLSRPNNNSGAVGITGANATLTITNTAAAGTGTIGAFTGASGTTLINLLLDGAGSNGTIAFTNNLLVNSGVVATINVNNNGMANTNNVVQFNGAGVNFGNGTVNVTGANGYSLFIANINPGGPSGTVTFNPTTAALTIAAVTPAVASTYVMGLDGTRTDSAVTGIIGTGTSTALNVSKTNSGTWTLSGNNTYNGTTVVSTGTLLINGNQTGATGAITVNAVLGGSGTLGGIATVGATGTIAPGNSLGNLTSTTSVLFTTAGGTFAVELGVVTGSTGTSDKMTLTSGVLDFVTGSVLKLSQGAGFNLPTDLTDYTFTIGTVSAPGNLQTNGGAFVGSTYTYGGSSVGPIVIDVSSLPAYGSGTFTLMQSGNDLILVANVSPVPEPHHIMLICAGVLLVGYGLRRRWQVAAVPASAN